MVKFLVKIVVSLNIKSEEDPSGDQVINRQKCWQPPSAGMGDSPCEGYKKENGAVLCCPDS